MGTDGPHCRPGSGVPTPVENSGSVEEQWPPPAPEPLSCGLGIPLSSAPETEDQPPPPCFLLQISLSYPERSANILFHVLLICIHTQSFARFCSPWWGSCQSLNKRPLPVDASVATTLCILPLGTHVIDSTVHLRWAFRHNILVHFP